MNAPLVEHSAVIDALLGGGQYVARQRDKESRLFPIVRDQCLFMAEQCPPYERFLNRCGLPAHAWSTLADIPPLPVSAFKSFDLSAVPQDRIVRELRSSSTTGQQPSRIFVDKTTAFLQARALVSVLKEHVGSRKRPLLVMDAPDAMFGTESLVARGAAIRGLMNFASSTTYGLRKSESGELELDLDAVNGFFNRLAPDEHPLVFGFTFIVWTRFLEVARARNIQFSVPTATLLHSGGWKKLQSQAVSKAAFSARAAAVLGCAPERILDFYGMIEQLGSVFVDCTHGAKHAPAFADVILRKPCTLEPVRVGQLGIIEVVSILPGSYPGHVLLTEDEGELLGVDNCPCGGRGQYFRFTRRVEHAEIRGCGDTFAQSREMAR